jgi:hypothetical protein
LTSRLAAIAAIAFVLFARAACAQPLETPPPAPTAPPVPLPPAGAIPPTLTLSVTGSPATDPDVLYAQILAALDRQIRPSLRSGSSVRYGAIVPWPLLPLAFGGRAAVNVTVAIAGDGASAPVSGMTTVNVFNVAVAPAPPSVLFLSDDPEYLQSDGLVFRGSVTAERATRLYYYHADAGAPRDLDVVLTAAAPARVQLIESAAGPDLDVMSVGHTVSRDLLRYEAANEGIVVDLVPGRPFVVRHGLLLQGELVAGAVDVQVLSGAVGVSVLASPAGSRPETFLAGPRVAFDGHRRHGTFDLAGFGALAQSYRVGAPANAAVQYGGRVPTPRNLDPTDSGRDYGDYGVIHRITFTLVNPNDTPAIVYLYEKPLGGPVRSTFVVDGQLKELACARLSQPYLVSTYQLPPQTTGASTTVTMTDGGSFYPLEYGVTETPPAAFIPPVGTPDGCSPFVPSPPEPPEPAPQPQPTVRPAPR